ncbi:MAG: hypothetical protein IPJ28_17600 [Betaproteobacteria bacterium]|nr:hypothetical protein [Betaproteobacteria bacterium]
MATPSRPRPVAILVTPGTPEANNGNWRTARRWAGLLAGVARPIVQFAWDGRPADILIALHARKSAGSVERFKAAFPDRRIVVVLTEPTCTGTCPRARRRNVPSRSPIASWPSRGTP